MPELPEVELARRDLVRWTVARPVLTARVSDASVVRHKLSTNPKDTLVSGDVQVETALTGAVATHVHRVGKRLGWVFDNGAALMVHLGMSGKWVRRSEPPAKHVRLMLDMGDGEPLWFVDPRRFGCVVLLTQETLDGVLRKGLGPDALDEPLGADALAARFKTRSPIKNALLDQTRIAGMGNIHAAEALWRAGIAPHRRSDSLSAKEWEALAQAIPQQLNWTLDAEAAGEIIYLSERGAKNPFSVYGREAKDCLRCGIAVERAVSSGRSSFWCPGCQA